MLHEQSDFCRILQKAKSGTRTRTIIDERRMNIENESSLPGREYCDVWCELSIQFV